MKSGRRLPLVEELSGPLTAEEAFLRMSGRPHCIFLDSAMADANLGRYSFVAADPFEFVEMPVQDSGQDGGGQDGGGLERLEKWLTLFEQEAVPELPPFQGGAAGLLGYDLGRQLEVLPRPTHDEFQVPALAVGLYDTVVAFDHLHDRAWIVSQGFPEVEPDRRRRAEERLGAVRKLLARPRQTPSPSSVISQKPLAKSDLCPQYPAVSPGGSKGLEELTSNFGREQYLDAVRRAIEYILAGDIFQVNLAQRLLHPAACDSVELYRRLRRCNPAPFAGFFDLGEFQIVSASPERFLCVRDRLVESRPIKGTRGRLADADADRAVQASLRASEKDRAENVMIVDLLRNDLSRVCRADSITVDELCNLETYECVHHLVSSIKGRLAAGRGPIDLIRAAFPGGSVTGAPKVRAMEIIAELEPAARGAYCGSLGYVGFDGNMDLSILIRTITAGRGWWQAQVGGAVVAQSSPQEEYEETWHKAEGLLRAMRHPCVQ